MFGSLSLLLYLVLIGVVQATYSAHLLYQFPNSTFVDIENVGIRPNGQLLLNLITQPSTYYLDPTESVSSAKLLNTFPNATSVLGIAQTAPDVFAVVVGNYSTTTFTGIPGSFSIWSINLAVSSTPVVKKIASIPEAHALNGMTAFPDSPDLVLIADSVLGAVFSMNIASGAYSVAIQDTAAFGPTSSFPLGINGLHTRGQTLYFTNSAKGTYGSVPITKEGSAAGTVAIIANDTAGNTYDDFALDQNGNAWIANHPNAVSEVTLGGAQMIIAGGGNTTEFVQPTSAIFGTGAGEEQCTLYVVTGGSASATSVESGQVFAIDVC